MSTNAQVDDRLEEMQNSKSLESSEENLAEITEVPGSTMDLVNAENKSSDIQTTENIKYDEQNEEEQTEEEQIDEEQNEEKIDDIELSYDISPEAMPLKRSDSEITVVENPASIMSSCVSITESYRGQELPCSMTNSLSSMAEDQNLPESKFHSEQTLVDSLDDREQVVTSNQNMSSEPSKSVASIHSLVEQFVEEIKSEAVLPELDNDLIESELDADVEAKDDVECVKQRAFMTQENSTSEDLLASDISVTENYVVTKFLP